MNLTSPSDVRTLLGEMGIRPRRSLGQNFLIDKNILDLVLAAADVRPGDHVLEIGPGLGVLTEHLLTQAGRVVAVEKDKGLSAFLRERLGGRAGFELVPEDALEADLESVLCSGSVKVVSNLPYASGSRILVRLVRARRPPEQMTVTVQMEVAERLAAPPGGRDYGGLSVWAQRLYDVEIVKRISPTCFWPRPEVRSALVNLHRHGRIPLSPDEADVFYGVTKGAFMQRRKQLATTLGRLAEGGALDPPAARRFLESLGVGEKARPETLGAEHWAALARHLAGHGGGKAGVDSRGAKA
jgi:16S rRNA (adenine1518-N6/adenine1519-N6)-dimethyltransferase